jgi:hypothetical protein
MMATFGTRKALLVLILVSLAAASVLADGSVDVVAGMSAVAWHWSPADEAVALLLSGSLLIGLAGALRRLAL